MAAQSKHAVYPTVWVTLMISLVLQVMPMPESMLLLRPHWLAMTLIYWCLALPRQVGVFHGFCAGLLLDLLEGTPMGQNALLLSVVAFLALLLYQRMRVYSLWQQAPMVMVITGLVLLGEQWLRVAFGVSRLHVQFIFSALLSGMLWPWFFTLMLNVRRRFAQG
ncbi:rod shape-determining protein MreD [Halotalea alkalilenta]|uniref:Rod shape-determining protein MreD n=1 Tax=Halotalea alkalilenta TaxID=376489 RepID=A0A172YE53_9GAMM|nr:rod shape-determining protein MreD [Halotalea alkalilenta]ANF57504.1 rod shape-determining protein MreD [Halotalea alkalilenta]